MNLPSFFAELEQQRCGLLKCCRLRFRSEAVAPCVPPRSQSILWLTVLEAMPRFTLPLSTAEVMVRRTKRNQQRSRLRKVFQSIT